ncbi:MAG TPA: DMT family transporter [Marinobacterium sp.]|nr:DMT family transporter [Marinobacterium sp.]
MAVKPLEDRVSVGVVMMLFAVILFTGIDTSAKWLSMAGLPVLEIVFLRYFVHFLLSLFIYVPQDGLSVFRSNAPSKQMLRSIFLFLSTLFNFAALKYLPITVTTTIAFAGPIVTTLLAIPILGEKVGIHRIIAVCVGFLGVVLVIQPWGAAFHPAMILSLGNLLIVSGYFIMTRMIAGIESNGTQQIWGSGIASLALGPFALYVWVWPETTQQWLIVTLMGCFGAFGHMASTKAHRLADASILAPMFYTQVFWAALVGVWIFNTWPTVWTLSGGLVIICSGIYIWHRERRKKRQPTPPRVDEV